jgi:AcrR family transcriptional regulator
MKRNGFVLSESQEMSMVPQLRPRVEGDREEEILEATIELLVELGYHRLTLDAVARQARASKATLYRRWESKPALVIDALIKAKDMPDPELPNTGSLRGDLIATFCGTHGMANSRATEVLGSVITAVSTDEEFARLFRERFIAPKLAVTEAIYAHAIERGEISPDIDLDIIGPALAGVCLHRAYLMGQPPDEELITRVIDHLIIPAATHGAPVSAS